MTRRAIDSAIESVLAAFPPDARPDTPRGRALEELRAAYEPRRAMTAWPDPMAACANCSHLLGEHYVSEPHLERRASVGTRRCHHVEGLGVAASALPAGFAPAVMCDCRTPQPRLGE